MASRVLPLTCVVPAGTAIATPVPFKLVFQPSNVDRIDVRVPPGPAGLVGFAIQYGGGNFIPEGSGQWIIADDQYITWPLQGAPDGGNWQVSAYNLDVLPHTLYFYFLISTITDQGFIPSSGLIGA